ncbi:MAG: hypothetical protein COV70_01380 [Parcubacteria group bacterium CG11_big_fil_rev_8_21_14_0_20_39_22]|nr:MAG: hypothetical protein COV70_01380 [Parcubacteria group bacterium CG11_big_fil_rev_8_21_14_0_20_39_22]
MVSWSAKRKITIISILSGMLVVFIALPIFFVLYKAPTCFDGKQNQGESGVDCGGSCSLLCEAEALEPIVHWQRAFKVTDGVYTATAYVENPNLDSSSQNVPYSFKLYDSNNILISERKGRTFIPVKKSFAIFEDTILTGEREPVRTFFEFLDEPVWNKTEVIDPPIRIKSRILTQEETSPRIDAVVENITLNPVSNIEVVAIIYNSAGNSIATSRTKVDRVGGFDSAPIVFTWPEPFKDPVSRIETIFRVIP